MSSPGLIEILSGQRTGVFPSLLRTALCLAAPCYAAVTCLRNRLYDVGWLTSHAAAVPVISVGNITTGGTGKTPTVAWLVSQLQQQGLRPGILSRGYRSLDGSANDEKLLLDEICPQVPHVQNRDRVVGAQTLLSQHDCNVLLLDDGLQHRRLQRNVDLVLIDALNPFGYGHLLPRGLLRESLTGLQRASAILITRADQLATQQLEALEQELRRWIDADCPIQGSRFRPTALVNAQGERLPFAHLRSDQLCAFTGIGNPEGFRKTLRSVGLAVTPEHFRSFPDHHHYTLQDLHQLADWGRQLGADAFLVTRKDLVKLQRLSDDTTTIAGIPIWAVDIELELLDPQAAFMNRVLLSL